MILIYDQYGRVVSSQRLLSGGWAQVNLSYDQLNRYKGVTIYNPNAPNGMTRGTYYNGGGNITSRTLVGAYTYGENSAPPHAVTTITQQGNLTHYGYDANGRLTSGAGYASVTWNPYNEPTELEANADENPPSVWLGYDPDGNLLTKTVYGSAQWRYFGKLFVQTGSSYRERIAANGEVVAVMNVNSAGFPSVNYLIHDNLGSTAAVLDASGALEGRYAWDVWGDLVNPATGNGPDPNQSADEALTSLGYTGHEMFWAAGFVHTQMRLYAPAIGRWLSPDSIVPNLYDGQSLNRYSYVLNNPMTFMDPLGLCTETFDGPSCTGGILLQPIVVTPASTTQLSNIVCNPYAGCPIGPCIAECALQHLTLWMSFNVANSPDAASSYNGSGGGGSGSNSNKNPQQNHHCTAPGYSNQRNFVNSNKNPASQIANQLQTATGNILGLAANESGYGSSGITAVTNNYFGLEAGSNFATGAVGAYTSPLGFSYEIYPGLGTGLYMSGEAFAHSSFGSAVYGTQTPQAFASALELGTYKFNDQFSYYEELINTTETVNSFLACQE